GARVPGDPRPWTPGCGVLPVCGGAAAANRRIAASSVAPIFQPISTLPASLRYSVLVAQDITRAIDQSSRTDRSRGPQLVHEPGDAVGAELGADVALHVSPPRPHL